MIGVHACHHYQVGAHPCEDKVGVSALVHLKVGVSALVHLFLLPCQGRVGVSALVHHIFVYADWLLHSVMSTASHIADVHEPYLSMQALLECDGQFWSCVIWLMDGAGCSRSV